MDRAPNSRMALRHQVEGDRPHILVNGQLSDHRQLLLLPLARGSVHAKNTNASANDEERKTGTFRGSRFNLAQLLPIVSINLRAVGATGIVEALRCARRTEISLAHVIRASAATQRGLVFFTRGAN